MINKKQINKIINIIKSNFQPDKIILFGSYADNTQKEDSDLDLLIINSKDLPSNYEVRRKISHLKIPVDVIVKNRDEFEKYKNIIGTVCYPADKFGKVVYEKRD